MNETGFQMGLIATAKVIAGEKTKDSRAKAIQLGNREWVTAIVTVSASGWALPPQIIFASKKHQASWYEKVPDDWVLSMSENE
jgi:hypothetical protein